MWKEINTISDKTAMAAQKAMNHSTTAVLSNFGLISLKYKMARQNERVEAVMKEKNMTVSMTGTHATFYSCSVFMPDHVLGEHLLIHRGASAPQDLEHFSSSSPSVISPYQVIKESHSSSYVFPSHLSPIVGHTGNWTQYMSDVGGQLEFQELYSSLLRGPVLFYHAFRADRDLHTKFEVKYVHKKGNSSVPYEASMTTKDAILQFLASVSSVRQSKKPGGGKQAKPKVFFIATHTDKLESDDKIMEVDRKLQQIVKVTEAYQNGLVVHSSEICMLFPVNNLSKYDKDFQRVRDVVNVVVTHCDDFNIRTPLTWSLFAVTIQHYDKPVLTYDTCLEVGKECGIDGAEEMDNCLWFLHYQTGILRHFKDIPELRNLVFKNPQHIFDIVNHLILSTFTHENLAGVMSVQEELVKKGIFSLEILQDLLLNHETLPADNILSVDQIIKLLEYHLIVAPIREDGVITKYFLPCALVHADFQSCPEPAPHWLPSLLFTFSSGYCPIGLFGAMVATLLHRSAEVNKEWTFEELKIFRNQICFSVGPCTDQFRFTVTSTFIRVDVLPYKRSYRKASLASVCCHVKKRISEALDEVPSKINYDKQKTRHMLAFQCTDTKCPRAVHAANVIEYKGEPSVMKCSITHRGIELPEGHQIWFDEEVCI